MDGAGVLQDIKRKARNRTATKPIFGFFGRTLVWGKGGRGWEWGNGGAGGGVRATKEPSPQSPPSPPISWARKDNAGRFFFLCYLSEARGGRWYRNGGVGRGEGRCRKGLVLSPDVANGCRRAFKHPAPFGDDSDDDTDRKRCGPGEGRTGVSLLAWEWWPTCARLELASQAQAQAQAT